jgi:hypothetical protein
VYPEGGYFTLVHPEYGRVDSFRPSEVLGERGPEAAVQHAFHRGICVLVALKAPEEQRLFIIVDSCREQWEA